MKLAIVVEAIPPYCGGGEQVAWVHAVEMAAKHEVTVVTFGESYGRSCRERVDIHFLPRRKRNLVAYGTVERALINRCLDYINPSVIHCHMPNILSACLRKKNRIMVSTIHDGVPENELVKIKGLSPSQWVKFKFIRRINISKSDAITCVSRYSCDVMRSIYPDKADKFSFIPNPIHKRLLDPVSNRDDGYVLNFGRQIPMKMAALLEVARMMPKTRFVFVGTGEMVRDHGLPNVEFVGFSESVETFIDAATLCVFPSLSENFPLVGLEAMARGKAVIATQRGFSEYIDHMKNGFLVDSTDTAVLIGAIEKLINDKRLRRAIGVEARKTAENYHPAKVMEQYDNLYQASLNRAGIRHD